MAIETNAKRIVRIMKGDTQVWSDDMNWTDIALNGLGRNAQYIVLPGNILLFKGDVTQAELVARGNGLITVPSKFKNLKIASISGDKIIANTDAGATSYWVKVIISGNNLNVVGNGNSSYNPTYHLLAICLTFTD